MPKTAAAIQTGLRYVRRDLKDFRRTKVINDFTPAKTAAERTSQKREFLKYQKTCTSKLDAFKPYVDEFMAIEWREEKDQKDAEKQIEEDLALIADTQAILDEIAAALENLNEVNVSSQIKLPKMAFPVYDGNIMNWQQFWNRFEATVHNNPTISELDKMNFLIGQLTSDAARPIQGLAIAEGNYATAIQILKEKYGQKDIIINKHYQELTALQKAPNSKLLQQTFDQIELHMNALKALGEDTNHQHFATIIMGKLPPPVAIKMEEKREDEGDNWNVDQLRNHLRKYLQISEKAYSQPLVGEDKSKQTHANASSTSKKGKQQNLHSASALIAQPKANKGHSKSKQAFHQKAGRQCPFCNQDHYANQCTVITSISARKQKLREKALCYNCLEQFHGKGSTCPKTKPCYNCKQSGHNSAICPTLEKGNGTTQGRPLAQAAMVAGNPNQGTAAAAAANEPTPPASESACVAVGNASILQSVNATFITADGKVAIKARGVFDNGSQRTYITEDLAQRLKLQTLSTGTLRLNTFGEEPVKAYTTKKVEVPIQLKNGKIFKFYANTMDVITGNLTRGPLDAAKYKHLLKDLPMADEIPNRVENFKIQFLIGADYMWDFILGEKISLDNGLHLISSTLGWLLAGRQGESALIAHEAAAALYAHVEMDSDVQMVQRSDRAIRSSEVANLWELEILGIADRPTDLGDDIARQKFNETIIYDRQRYYVQWPWKEGHQELPTNFHLAKGRLESVIRRYKKEPAIFQQYQKIIEDQLAKGIIEKVPEKFNTSFPRHFIPHHAVITPGKTTKLRVVYDASTKARLNKPSLNDCLYRGAVILDQIPAILSRFRLSSIALASDIEKAFLQVGLQESQRDVVSFLWLEDSTKLTTENNIQVFCFTRVPFGVTSSPFLLGATIEYHLGKINTTISRNILQNIYVDNIITGVGSVEEAIKFYESTKEYFQMASMNVREWISNSPEVLQHIPHADHASGQAKVLGLPWNPKLDCFSFPTPSQWENDSPITKRTILRYLAKFYDPMGFTTPLLLPGKILLQEIWKMKLGWDDELPTQLKNQWINIVAELQSISTFTFPRYIGQGQQYELHCFVDASKLAYGAAVYLRKITDQKISNHLIFAKSRVAPIQPMTIPRLELLAALVGTKCLKFMEESLHVPVKQKYLWSDSKCVLHWIKSDKPLSTFVTNRLKSIRSIKNLEFGYVSTKANPADIASRGCTFNEWINGIWWTGPAWLVQSQNQWPKCVDLKNYDSTTLQQISTEQKKTVFYEASLLTNDNVKTSTPFGLDPNRYSSFSKLLRVTVYCNRFMAKLKRQPLQGGPITSTELEEATKLWIKSIQSMGFADVQQAIQKGTRNPIKDSLDLWIDSQGIIRCRTRISNAAVPWNTANPILLPKGHPFTKLVILDYHHQTMHSGPNHTLAQLRNRYWIPKGRLEVTKLIRSCLICRRVEGGPFKPPKMPQLPSQRLTESPPFTHTGLDYLGPIFIKNPDGTKRKVWVCLFSCMVVRAIHLEMVEDLTTDQFLMALRRFISRRGTPSTIISDNAKTFKLAKDTIQLVWKNVLNDSEVQSYCSSRGIQWKFITERAPWMGGFYERLVGLVKRAFKKSIQAICLTSMQLQSLLAEIEATINSRPLTYVGSDIQNGQVLTPTHFLSINAHNGTPNLGVDSTDDPDYNPALTSPEGLLQTWKKGHQHLQTFWQIWRTEYLLSLRERRHHWKPVKGTMDTTPKVGDVVLIKDNDLPRGAWKMGMIQEIILGSDGEIRSVKVKTPTGRILQRPIVHLYPIEGNSEEPAPVDKPTTPAASTSAQGTITQASGSSRQRPQCQAAQIAKTKFKQIARYEDISDSEQEENDLFNGLVTGSTVSRAPTRPQATIKLGTGSQFMGSVKKFKE